MKNPAARLEPKQRPDAEIAVDRMQIERRHRDVMRVSEPAALAGALPGVLARFGGKFSRRGVPYAGPRPVEADPHRRAGREREHGGAELAVHVDDEVVGVGAQLGGEPA